MSSSKGGLFDRLKKKIPGHEKPKGANPISKSSANTGSLSLRPITPASVSRSSSPSSGNQNHPPSVLSSSPKPVNVVQQSGTSPPIRPTSLSSNVSLINVGTHTTIIPTVSAVGNPTSKTTMTINSSTAQKGPVSNTASERLWAKAYAALEQDEPDLVKSFKLDASSITTTQVSITPPELARNIELKLKKQDSERLMIPFLNKQIKVRDQAEKVVKFIMWSKDVIGAAASLEPHAAIAWAGVSLLLPLILNNSEQNHDMMAGLEQISDLILLYKARESLYLEGPEPLDPNLTEFEHRVIGLYTKILEYQVRMYLQLGRRAIERGARNLVKVDDWSGWSTEILALDALCLKFTGIIDVGREHAYMSSQSDYARMQIDLDKKILHVMEAILLSQRERSNNKCLQALSSDYKGQKNLVPRRVPKTCEWFLTDQRYLDWRDKRSSAMLWVSADPGCGKSVLARCLIDERFLSKSTTTSTICYFFFKDGQEGRNESQHALAAILHCLFSSNLAEDLIKHAELSYQNHSDKIATSFTELWDILMDVAADPNAGEIICLIDALDECRADSRDVFLRSIIEYYGHERLPANNTTRLKFIITSRPYSDIHNAFAKLERASTYIHCSGEDETEKISQEIDRVIAVRVPRQLSRLKAEAQQQIIKYLCETKGRTYLWLHLTLDLLQKTISTNNTVERIQKVMASLPRTVHNNYSALLEKSSDSEQARVLLQIITVARQPLTLHELRVAWEIARDEDGSFTKYKDLADFLFEDANFPTDLRNLCGLLISIHDGRVYLLHQTVREFLVGQTAKIFPHNEAQFDINEAEGLMAGICTKYLALNDFARVGLIRYGRPQNPGVMYLTMVKSLHDQFTFLEYAASHWFVHVQIAQSPTGFADIENNLQLVSAGSNRCRLWLSEWCRTEDLAYEHWSCWHDLTIAAAVGVEIIVETLLDRGLIGNDHGREDTALWASARWGHVKVVELLLARGFDINGDDMEGNSALAAAAEGGHESVVKLFLKSGTVHHPEVQDASRMSWAPPALLGTTGGNHEKVGTLLDINAQNDRGRTALHCAIRYQHGAIALLLIEHGADVHVYDSVGRNTLTMSAEYGMAGLTETLLNSGADINSRYDDGNGLVAIAAEHGHESVVKLLLDKGADFHTQNNEGKSPIAIAAQKGHGSVIRRLFDRGADLNTRDCEGNEPIALAAKEGHQDTVKLLLDLGADVNSQDYRGNGLFTLAIRSGMHREGVIKLLLDSGANLNIQNDDGETALDQATRDEDEDIVELLLNSGADFSVALHVAAASGYENIFGLLLGKCADINARAEDGHTVLERAAEEGRVEMVKLLLEKNANLGGALQLAAFRGRANVLDLLLDRGADIDARDAKYSNYSALEDAVHGGQRDIVKYLLEKGANTGFALHIAARLNKETILKLLLDHGAHIDARDRVGDTVLINATFDRREDIVRLLLEKGADINARGRYEESALDLAILAGYETIAQMLLDHGADINTRNRYGHKALDHATLRGYEEIAQMLIDHGAEISPEFEDWPSKQLQSLFGDGE